jgi:predicted metal-dependent phosphoesterase TrpH
MRLDLHIHSRYSDGKDGVEDILGMAQRRGLAGIAITDHDTLKGSDAALKVVQDKDLVIMVIRGVEVTTSEGHLLALGVEEMPPLRRSPEETVEAVLDLGGISVVPHPYHLFRHGLGRIPKVDAVEVYNSKHLFGLANARARWVAKRRCIPMVAGSDSHLKETVGLGVTEVDVDKDPSPEDVLEAIRAGKTSISGVRTPPRLFAGKFLRGLWRRACRRLIRQI